MRSQLYYRALFLAWVLIALAGCNSEPPTLMRIGTFTWPGYEPLQLASAEGFYGRHNVRLVEYSSATQVARAFRNGAIEAATLTLDETLRLVEQQAHPRVILALDASNGADVVLGQPDVHALEDLRNRRVGFEPTGVSAYMLARALDHTGINPQDVTLVPVEADEHSRAFREKRVDAIATFEPHRSHLLAEGANLLFDSADIPGEIFDVLVIHDSVLEQNPELAPVVVQGWEQAVRLINDRPEQRAAWLSKRLGVEPSQLPGLYARVQL